MEPVQCPSCHAQVEPPQAAGPFFCPKCHEIVDPKGALRSVSMRSSGEAPPAPSSAPQPSPPKSGPGKTTTPLSELGSPFAEVKRTIQGPGLAVGGSIILGYVLAAIAGIALAVGFGWLAGNVVRVPIVFPLLVGWGIRRALAAGAGGGTPDRGPVGSFLLLAIVVATFGILRYADYLTTDRRESTHYRAVFGGFPTDAESATASLRQRDPDGDRRVEIPESGRVVSIEEEIARIQSQEITHVEPSTPYDVALLASVGKKGFTGYALHAVTKGETIALRPTSRGWTLPGVGVVVLWLLEFVLLLLSAFAKVDD